MRYIKQELEGLRQYYLLISSILPSPTQEARAATQHFCLTFSRSLNFPEALFSLTIKWSTMGSKLRLTWGPRGRERLWGCRSLYTPDPNPEGPKMVEGGTEDRATWVLPPQACSSLLG